jgi:hypothetical protein
MQQFYSIIYSSYRKNFTPLLTESKEIIAYVETKFKPTDTFEKIHTTTDSNWGCTIRVGQMMLCQALMRARIGLDQSMASIVKSREKSHEYRAILRSILDNDITSKGAFSI